MKILLYSLAAFSIGIVGTINTMLLQQRTAVKDNTLATCNLLVKTLVPTEVKPSCIYLKDRLTFKFTNPNNGSYVLYDVETTNIVREE